MSAPRFEQLLTSRSLYFCPLTAFNDGLEGKLTERTQRRFFNWHYQTYGTSDNALGALSSYLEHQQQFLVNCWHMNNAESYLMWKAYAERGVAIQTTFERACASFDDFKGSITGGVVDYIDYARGESEFGNVFIHVATKDIPYADERELRFLLWRCDQANAPMNISADGHSVAIDLNMLIERIYLNPFFPGLADSLLPVITKAGLQDRLVNSSVVLRVLSSN